MNPNDVINERDYYPHVEGKTTEEEVEVDPLLLKVSDDMLVQEIEDRIEDSDEQIEVARLRNNQKWNEEYYYGDQLRRITLMGWQAPVVENRIFMSIETLIPMMTAQAGDPDIRALVRFDQPEPPKPAAPGQQPQPQLPDPTNENPAMVDEYIDTLTAMILHDYNVTLGLKDKIREIIRHWFLYRYGVGKLRLDPITGEIVFDVVHPRNVYLPGKNQPKGWKAEYKEDTVDDLIKMFPEAKDKIAEEIGWDLKLGPIPDKMLGTKFGYFEYWRPNFVAWKFNKSILRKIKNPNWDWTGEQRISGATIDPRTGKMKPIKDLFKWNVLKMPRDPYFIFNYFRVTGQEYDDTSLIEQARPVQDLINKRKRQIAAIADDSGLVVASGDGIPEEEFQKYDGSPRSKLWISTGNPNMVIARIQGASATPTMLEDLKDSRDTSDNLFGTQAVSRGQTTPSMAGESGVARQILRNADMSRVGPLAERVETFLQDVYEYLIQMRMMFTDEDYHVPIASPSSDSEVRNLTFNKYNIPMVKVTRTMVMDGKTQTEDYFCPIPITVTVSRGSTLPKDPVAEYERDTALYQQHLIDPLTIYEKMGLANPQQKLERLYRWNNFPLSLMSKDLQEELMPLIMRPPKKLTETMRYSDMPADIKRQLESQAGFTPSTGADDEPQTRITETINFADLPPILQQGMAEKAGILPANLKEAMNQPPQNPGSVGPGMPVIPPTAPPPPPIGQ